MIKKNSPEALRPTVEDLARALGYLGIMAWAVLFAVFPPNAFVTALEVVPRILWMSVTFIGALAAFLGALLRIDIKMELPGLMVTHVGPLFYFASQLFYVMFPMSSASDPAQRYALVVYALLPGLLLLPRTVSLFREARRLKKINLEAEESARQLLEAQEWTHNQRHANGGR